MVISHAHRYLFVALPRTGGTAVERELQKFYGGERILKKHSTYRDFLKVASGDEKSYFVFSTVRNPLDKIASLYFKYVTDNRDYSNPETFKNQNPLISRLMRNQFDYVQQEQPTFPEFFRRYYWFPYDDWSCLDHKSFHRVMRFESIASDFESVLLALNLQPVRQLPVANKTAERKKEFWDYYTDEIVERAKWVFGPYCRKWGYSFPESWGEDTPRTSEIAYAMINPLRTTYWRFLR